MCTPKSCLLFLTEGGKYDKETQKYGVFTSSSARWSQREEVPTLSLSDGEEPPYDVETGEEHTISVLLQRPFLCLAPHLIGSIITIFSPFSFAYCFYFINPSNYPLQPASFQFPVFFHNIVLLINYSLATRYNLRL
jgi:hypothetical protein